MSIDGSHSSSIVVDGPVFVADGDTIRATYDNGSRFNGTIAILLTIAAGIYAVVGALNFAEGHFWGGVSYVLWAAAVLVGAWLLGPHIILNRRSASRATAGRITSTAAMK